MEFNIVTVKEGPSHAKDVKQGVVGVVIEKRHSLHIKVPSVVNRHSHTRNGHKRGKKSMEQDMIHWEEEKKLRCILICNLSHLFEIVSR